MYTCVHIFMCVCVCMCVYGRRSLRNTLARRAGRSIALSSSDSTNQCLLCKDICDTCAQRIALSSSDSSSDASKPSELSACLRTYATQLFKRQMRDLSSCAARNPSLQLLVYAAFSY